MGKAILIHRANGQSSPPVDCICEKRECSVEKTSTWNRQEQMERREHEHAIECGRKGKSWNREVGSIEAIKVTLEDSFAHGGRHTRRFLLFDAEGAETIGFARGRGGHRLRGLILSGADGDGGCWRWGGFTLGLKLRLAKVVACQDQYVL